MSPMMPPPIMIRSCCLLFFIFFVTKKPPFGGWSFSFLHAKSHRQRQVVMHVHNVCVCCEEFHRPYLLSHKYWFCQAVGIWIKDIKNKRKIKSLYFNKMLWSVSEL